MRIITGTKIPKLANPVSPRQTRLVARVLLGTPHDFVYLKSIPSVVVGEKPARRATYM